jgi:primosomal protein N' (replication factor Y)
VTIHDVGVELDAGGRNLASVVVDSALPHLDRAFDYVVPESLLARVAVGSRVRVPFAGRLVSGIVTALPPEPPQGITLAHVKSAASVPSLTSEGIDLGRAVARRYGGSLWDVIRLMVPPRVASVEKRPWPSPGDADSVASLDAARATLAGDVPDVPLRAVWAVPPGSKRSTVPARQLLAHALAHTTARNGSAIIVVPDSRALRSLESAANEVGLRRWQPRTGGDVVVLDHDAGPTARYASYLAAMHGEARIVIGTRPVALQPVPRLASIAVWDEGSDALLEPHAPYFHARTVAAMRAQDANSAFLLAAYAPSVEAAALAEHGFVEAVVPQREQARATSPRVVIVGENVRRKEGGEGRHWMPSTAWRSLLEKAADRPVAVLVPRAGYVTALACVRCHTWATCPNCEGN